jgi:hypothetical protein
VAEYFSFEKVLKELQLDEEELKRMVSEGQIRAFRDDDKMKFRGDDIDSMKKGRQTDPTIILPGSGVEADDDDLGLDDFGDGDMDLDEEIALVEDDTSETLLDLDEVELEEDDEPDVGADTLAGDLMLDDEPELSLDDDDEDQIGTQPMETAMEETFVDDDDEEVGMTTEPLELVDDEEDEVDEPRTVVASKNKTQRAPQRSGRSSARQPVPEQGEGMGWTIALVMAAAIMLYVGMFAVDMMGRPGASGGATEPVAKLMSEKFLGEKWEKTNANKLSDGSELDRDLGMDDDETDEDEEEEGGDEEGGDEEDE